MTKIKPSHARRQKGRIYMNNNLNCSDIIPQISPDVQNAIDIINKKAQEWKNSEQYKRMTAMSESIQEKFEAFNKKIELKLDPEVQDKLEQIKHNVEIFNEQVKTLLEKAVVIVKKTAVNIYKKIISCSRAVRSHNKVSTFSKSSSGDSGDSDQPEPPRSTPLIIPQKRNSYSYSWRTVPGKCCTVGGGQA